MSAYAIRIPAHDGQWESQRYGTGRRGGASGDLIVDSDPLVFSDTLAYTLLGDRAEELIGYHRAHGAHPVLSGARTAVVTRSRYTEERLEEAVRRGVDQYVVLGAGLDTFAYRSHLADRVRVFEVDHPATQRWKRRLLAEAGIAPPDGGVFFVPVDFETESLGERLARNGFDETRPAFVSWLGVTMYLDPKAIGRTPAEIGTFATGSEIVLDYLVPEEMRDEGGRAYAGFLMPEAARRGEPWVAFFRPKEMSALLEEHRFRSVGHVGQYDSIGPGLWERSDPLRAIELPMPAHAKL